jgi:hypothetical protein
LQVLKSAFESGVVSFVFHQRTHDRRAEVKEDIVDAVDEQEVEGDENDVPHEKDKSASFIIEEDISM